MIHIAICDDDLIFSTELENMLNSIANEYKLIIEIDIFYSGNKFKKNILNCQKYDLIFLDIELNETLGSEIGDFIRNKLEWENVSIIYISNKSNYALSLFKTRPHDFIVKPISYNNLRIVMGSYFKLYNKNVKPFEYKIGRNYHKENLNNILYFEGCNKTVIMHCLKENITIFSKLTDIESNIDGFFLRIHRSYLINYNMVKDIYYDEVVMINNDKLPISQGNRKMIRRMQMKGWMD